MGEEGCNLLLSTFSSENKDVESFLIQKSISFEKKGISRTYLIIDDLDILGYFSLSTKEVSLEGIQSKTEIKKIDGFNKNAKTAKAFLIGQIGKNFSIKNNSLNLETILQEAYSYINVAQNVIGGRMVLIECEDKPKLLDLYERNGFKLINIVSNPEETQNDLRQLYRIIELS